MRVNKLLVAAALLAGSATAFADQDLVTTYQEALQSDPVYQQAIANRNAVEEQLPQAKANVRPQITGNGSLQQVHSNTDFDNAGSLSEDFHQLNFGAQLSQTLYDWSNFKQVDQAQAVVKQAKANFSAAQQGLVVRVAQRYFGVLDAQVALQAAQAELKAIKRQLEQARQRFEVGVIARTDVEQAKARYDLSQASLLQAQDNLESARERLRELIGAAPEPLYSVRDGVNFTSPKPSDESAWRQRAEDQNPTLLAARYGAQASMKGVDVARGGHY
ncbi:MAG TPA: TolC family protein, partial [Gammaproteobacteria bacterium]|nr:TolC family protein [Gammaproteobacteria bacterium]